MLPIFSLTAASDGTPPPLMLAGPGEGRGYPPTIFYWKAEAVSSKFLDKSGLLSARVAPPAWLLFKVLPAWDLALPPLARVAPSDSLPLVASRLPSTCSLDFMISLLSSWSNI